MREEKVPIISNWAPNALCRKYAIFITNQILNLKYRNYKFHITKCFRNLIRKTICLV